MKRSLIDPGHPVLLIDWRSAVFKDEMVRSFPGGVAIALDLTVQYSTINVTISKYNHCLPALLKAAEKMHLIRTRRCWSTDDWRL